MDTSKRKICISLCTYKRPGMLSRALDSLRRVVIPKEVEIRFLLADNESDNHENRALFDAFKESVEYQCEFLVETNPGISYMRNRVLDHVTELDVDFLLIFDDDQTLDPMWLAELLACQEKYEADVVRGHVIYQYPREVELSESLLIYNQQKKTYKTGDLLLYCGEGNVLIRMDLVNQLGLRHNLNFNKTGGSDALFFYQMTDAGGKIVYCEEAISYEEVPASRTTDQWAYQRMFRIGYTKYLLQVYRFGKKEALRNTFWFWMRRAYQNWRKIRRSPVGETVELKLEKVYLKGIISSIIGRKFSEYDVIHGY